MTLGSCGILRATPHLASSAPVPGIPRQCVTSSSHAPHTHCPSPYRHPHSYTHQRAPHPPPTPHPTLHFPQVKTLRLGNNSLSGPAFPPAWLAEEAMAALTELSLSGNRGLGGELPPELPWPSINTL